jgi:hypothetical protein
MQRTLYFLHPCDPLEGANGLRALIGAQYLLWYPRVFSECDGKTRWRREARRPAQAQLREDGM